MSHHTTTNKGRRSRADILADARSERVLSAYRATLDAAPEGWRAEIKREMAEFGIDVTSPETDPFFAPLDTIEGRAAAATAVRFWSTSAYAAENLAEAMVTEWGQCITWRHGIWGGLTPRQRWQREFDETGREPKGTRGALVDLDAQILAERAARAEREEQAA